MLTLTIETMFFILFATFSVTLLGVQHSLQAESCTNSRVNVRLVSGTSARNGQVELCWSNQWKAVCDDGWGLEEAITVCRELGYLNGNGGAIAVSGSYFGDAQEIHQLQQWNCESTETTLAYCRKTIAHRHCSASETAGVYCQGAEECMNGEFRLMNGNSPSRYEGRLEICHNGFWGTVCSEGWDSTDAAVVCKELGISVLSLAIAVLSSEIYGGGEGPILLNEVNCSQHDTRLAECRGYNPTYVVDTARCTHSNDAAVICKGGSNCSNGEIRLTGGTHQSEGIVEICFDRIWGTICSEGWDDSDATVVCRQLALLQGCVTMGNAIVFERETHKVQHLGQVRCSGQESRLTYCSHDDVDVNKYSNNVAAVTCAAPGSTFHCQGNSTTSAASPTQEKTNVSSGSPLTLGIIIGGICCGTVLLTVGLLTTITAVLCVRKRRQQQYPIKQSVEHQDKPEDEHIYDDIPTAVTRKPTKQENPYTAAIQLGHDSLYQTPRAAVIKTSINEAYGYMLGEQIYIA